VIPYAIGDIAQYTSQATTTGIDAHALDGLRVLLVDDNEYNRMLAKDTLLAKSDVVITTAENGMQAIELLGKYDFDIILMDVQMPEMNGFEATRYIRNNFQPPTSEIPVIALTASVLRTDLDKCRQAGMNTYVPKPFKAVQLFSAIAELTGRNIVAHAETKSASNFGITSGVTDLTFLRQFTEGDQVALQRYIHIYIEKTEQHLKRLQQAIESNDFGEIKTVVHIMKGHFKMMGMSATIKLAMQAELMVEEEDYVACLRDLHNLIDQCKLSIRELQKVE
jgi:CheY-like chemotaxis protein